MFWLNYFIYCTLHFFDNLKIFSCCMRYRLRLSCNFFYLSHLMRLLSLKLTLGNLFLLMLDLIWFDSRFRLGILWFHLRFILFLRCGSHFLWLRLFIRDIDSLCFCFLYCLLMRLSSSFAIGLLRCVGYWFGLWRFVLSYRVLLIGWWCHCLIVCRLISLLSLRRLIDCLLLILLGLRFR